jgi:hypothetical protein
MGRVGAAATAAVVRARAPPPLLFGRALRD